MSPVPCAEQLARALDEDALALAYQPIVRLADGRVEGVEALLRWDDVPAEQAVALAGEAGLLGRLGAWVLHRALGDLARWRAAPAAQHLTVSVNVSPLQLDDPGFARMVNLELARHDLPADALVLELTEAGRLAPGAGRVVGALRRLGVAISIDDLGVGDATALRVLGLPAGELKFELDVLERVSGVGGTFAALVQRAVEGGLRGVVERIETREQLAAAVSAGCTHAQGFLLGRPAQAADVPRQVAERRPLG